MIVIEQFLKSKTHNELDCEDSIFVSENFAAVIDGVTSKSEMDYAKETSGRACSQFIRKALEKLPFKSSASQAVEFLTSAVYSMYTSMGIEEQVNINPNERASACIVIYSRFKKEIWMVGDCQCLVDGIYYSNTKKIDTVLSEIRSLFIHTELRLGRTYDKIQEKDSGRVFILPLLNQQAVFQNSFEKNEYNYGVIDGFKVPESEIKVIKPTNPASIILATDGYPRIFDTLAQSERYLKKILKNDPLCVHIFKSTKGLKQGNISFDDRAYLFLRLKPESIES